MKTKVLEASTLRLRSILDRWPRAAAETMEAETPGQRQSGKPRMARAAPTTLRLRHVDARRCNKEKKKSRSSHRTLGGISIFGWQNSRPLRTATAMAETELWRLQRS